MRLEQVEAERLMGLEKRASEDNQYNFPAPGTSTRIPLVSVNGQELFILDMYRGRRNVLKCTYQERYGKVTPLVRLDLDSIPHPNPHSLFPPTGFESYNGIILTEPHIHLYVEEYGMKWVRPASLDGFIEPDSIDSLTENLRKFFSYCNITGIPNIVGVLL